MCTTWIGTIVFIAFRMNCKAKVMQLLQKVSDNAKRI